MCAPHESRKCAQLRQMLEPAIIEVSDMSRLRIPIYFDYAAGPLIGKLEIVRLDQDKRFFDVGLRRKVDHAIEDTAVAV